MIHGSVAANSDVHGKAMRTGSVTVTALETTKVVTFASALPDTSYLVFFQPEGNLASTLWATSKTTNDFTLNLSVGVVGSISYIAIQT